MRTLAFLLLCAAAARGGTTESGAPAARGIYQKPEAAVEDPPEKARAALDVLWPAVNGASRAWPGFDVLRRPLLIGFSDGTALLVGHPKPPPGFRRTRYRGMTAYVAERWPALKAPVRLDHALAGSRVTAVRAEPGGPPLEPILVAVHEMFHDFQRIRVRMPGDPHSFRYDIEDGEDIALATLENRALASWLETADEGALLDFAALRRRRRALFPGSLAEIAHEDTEGSADFIEAEARRAVEGKAAAREALARKLRAPVLARDMSRARLFDVGAALALVLESEAPGAWQADLAAGTSLSEMVLARSPLDAKRAARRAARLTADTGYEILLAAGRRDVDDRRRRREEQRALYKARAGQRIVLESEELPVTFLKEDGDAFHYPDGTVLHERVIEWIGEGKAGRYRLSGMPVLAWCRGGRSVEFLLEPEAEIIVDGRPWKAARDAAEFKSLLIRSRGVEIELDGGHLESLDGALFIFPAAR